MLLISLPCAAAALASASYTPTRVVLRTSLLTASEIDFSPTFLRAAKAALRQSLDSDGGHLSEDASATILALASVNPTNPDPSNDDDLWTGEFSLATAPLSSLVSALPLQMSHGCLRISTSSEDGGHVLELTASGVVAADASTSVTAAELRLVGRIKVVGDADLELQPESLILRSASPGCDVDDGLLQTCKQAGFAFDSSSANDGEWAVPPDDLPSARYRQLYLDQDCHILLRQDIDGAAEPMHTAPWVLFK